MTRTDRWRRRRQRLSLWRANHQRVPDRWLSQPLTEEERQIIGDRLAGEFVPLALEEGS